MYNIEYLKNNLPDLKIDYRTDLKIDTNSTYGLEIEFVEGIYSEVLEQLAHIGNLKYKWGIYMDSTVYELNKQDPTRNKGGEVLSPPITNEHEIWDDLKKVCNIIKNTGGTIDERPAGHIHVGSQTFENEKTINNFLLIWTAFEDIINKYFAGEFINPKNNNTLAIDCRKEFKEANFNLENLKKLRERNLLQIALKTYSVSTFYFANFEYEFFNTIEFRKIRGSLEEEIWQNNINFLEHLINYAKNAPEKDLKYIKKIYINTNEYLTEEPIKYEKAILLADLIFDKEIDKLYFLKQYFKDFKESNELNAKVNLIRK